MRTLFVTSLVVATAAVSAWAGAAKHWAAVDRITMESTGDLTLSGDRLSFDNDGTIHVRLLKSHVLGRWGETNAVTLADIYKVDPPVRPTSDRGDVLCDAAATYIVFSYPVPSDLVISVYTSVRSPKGDGSSEACAHFTYSAD